MLTPIENESGLYRDSVTGRVANMRNSRVFETTHECEGRSRISFVTPRNASLWIERWSLVLDKWPKWIDPDVMVRIECQFKIIASVPLFRLAQPSDRNAALEKRVERIEATLGLKASMPSEINILVPSESQIAFEVTASEGKLEKFFDSTDRCIFVIGGRSIIDRRT